MNMTLVGKSKREFRRTRWDFVSHLEEDVCDNVR